MVFRMEDFRRDYIKEHFGTLSAEDQQQVLKALPLENRLAGISADQLREYLDRLTKERPRATRKPRQKQ